MKVNIDFVEINNKNIELILGRYICEQLKLIQKIYMVGKQYDDKKN